MIKIATKKDFLTFQALSFKAKKTRDPMDIRYALNYGIDRNISAKKIRETLR